MNKSNKKYKKKLVTATTIIIIERRKEEEQEEEEEKKKKFKFMTILRVFALGQPLSLSAVDQRTSVCRVFVSVLFVMSGSVWLIYMLVTLQKGMTT